MPSEKLYLDKIQNKKARWYPQSKPQWLAFLSRADELFYGGAAGGGKSDLLLGLAGDAHGRSIIFRRVFPNLRFLIERSRQIYNSESKTALKDSYNESLHVWRLSTRNMIEFGAIQYEQDKSNFQGRPHDFIGFDEVAEFTESQFVFVTAWNRSTDPNQRIRVIATGNPPTDDAGSWVVRRWGAWLDKQHPHPAKNGELRWYATLEGKETEVENGDIFDYKGESIIPRSRTFISALLKDNIFLAADGRYKSVLQSLPEPLRSQLLYGDFDASSIPDPFQIIPTAWVRLAQKRWMEMDRPVTKMTAAGLDPSRGGMDKTALAMRYDNWFDEVKAWPGLVAKDGPTVAELVRQVLDKAEPLYINVDVAGIGSSVYDSLAPMFDGVHPFNGAEASEYRDRSGKLKMRNKRAEMYWKMRDTLDPENGDDIALPPDTELLADLCSAKYKLTTAGVQVEEKEQIKERIGRSPDIGEAVMMANMNTKLSWAKDLGKIKDFRSRWTE